MEDFLGLDGVNLEESLAGINEEDLEGYGDIAVDIDEPHFKVSSKEFKEILRTAKLISASTGRDPSSKALCLVPNKDGILSCYSTDYDVYLKKTLPILNTTNILEDTLVISIDNLIKLAKAVPSSLVIYKRDDKYFIKLFGGDMILETISINTDKYLFSDATESKGKINSLDLSNVLRDLSSIVTVAVSPEERRIMFSDTTAQVTYLWSAIKSRGSYAPLDLKLKDIHIIRSLLQNTADYDLELFRTTEDIQTARCVLKGVDFEYAFLISDKVLDDTQTKMIEEIVNNDGYYVDFNQLYKTVELSSELGYTIGKIEFNYSDDGLMMLLKNKGVDDSVFNIQGSKEGNPKPIGNNLILQSKLLRVILRSFTSTTSVCVIITEKGLGIKSEYYEAVIFNNQ